MPSQAEMDEQTKPNYMGSGKPAYMEPTPVYPSYSDYSNEGPANPVYVANDRGYTEYR